MFRHKLHNHLLHWRCYYMKTMIYETHIWKPEIIRVISQEPGIDPIASKYITSGLSREALSLTIANYGAIQRRFVNLSIHTMSYGKWNFNRTMLLKLWQCTTMIHTRH
ncbi:hypothetical protein GIB67_042593 [Kingdonia uniflora]|uniref:Uncharacterized protein n=1 Tax=Kingdonia uniflora TaxID=39325 RepID=A0A7J7M1F4_9MAGN|nr:hypothetical protein GIB67_042593 [Kingdonia uniflora]